MSVSKPVGRPLPQVSEASTKQAQDTQYLKQGNEASASRPLAFPTEQNSKPTTSSVNNKEPQQREQAITAQKKDESKAPLFGSIRPLPSDAESYGESPGESFVV